MQTEGDVPEVGLGGYIAQPQNLDGAGSLDPHDLFFN